MLELNYVTVEILNLEQQVLRRFYITDSKVSFQILHEIYSSMVLGEHMRVCK